LNGRRENDGATETPVPAEGITCTASHWDCTKEGQRCLADS
jgi:hypothetical protein